MTNDQKKVLRQLKAIENKAWAAMQLASKDGRERKYYPAWSKASADVRDFAAIGK